MPRKKPGADEIVAKPRQIDRRIGLPTPCIVKRNSCRHLFDRGGSCAWGSGAFAVARIKSIRNKRLLHRVRMPVRLASAPISDHWGCLFDTRPAVPAGAPRPVHSGDDAL